MKYDPFTLVVAIGKSGDAEGTLYLDDGESFDFQDGAFIHRQFRFNHETRALTSEDITPAGAHPSKKAREYLKSMENVRVERIVVVGAPESWSSSTAVDVSEEFSGKAKSEGVRKVALEYHGPDEGRAAWAVVRDPGVKIGAGWKVQF
jgi:alpha 1,3-glucosidase